MAQTKPVLPLPILFAPEASRTAGEAVAGHWHRKLAGLDEATFEDGERRLMPLEAVEGRATVLFQSLYAGPSRSLHDKLCDILFLAGALKDAGATQITLAAPYFCYARADSRRASGEPLTLRYLAQLAEAAGIDRVAAMDVHNPAAFENSFRIPALNIEGTQLFAEYLAKSLADQEIRLVSPDIGGLKRTARLREALSVTMNEEVELTALGKQRLDHIVNDDEIPDGLEQCAVVIFDDMIATGATMLRAARACRKGGARYVIAAATHGLFLAGAEALLEQGLLDRIIVTDSVPLFRLAPGQIAQKITILACAPAIVDRLDAAGGQ